MAILRVPFSLAQAITSTQRPDWASDFVENLGEFALVDMTFTAEGGGTAALTWSNSGDATDFVAHVVIDDPAATGVTPGSDGSPPTMQAAAERVVARALLDQGLTIEDSRIYTDQIALVESDEPAPDAYEADPA